MHEYKQNYLSVIYKHIKKQKIIFFLLLASSMFLAVQQAMMPIILRRIISVGTEFAPLKTIYIPISSSLITLVIIYTLAEFVIRTQGMLIARFMPEFRNGIKNHYLNLVVSYDHNYLSTRSSGYISDKINTVAASTERIFQILIYNFLSMGCSLSLISILLFLIEPIYAMILIAWFIVHYCITIIRLKSGLPHVEIHSNKYSQLTGIITECLDRISLIKIFESQNYESSRIKERLDEEAKLHIEASIYFEKSKILQGILTIFLFIGMIGLLISGLNSGKISFGNFAFVIFAVFNTVNYIWFSAFQLTIFFKEYGSLMNSLKILWHPQLQEIATNNINSYAHNIAISIKNVALTNTNNKDLIRNVEFDINHGDNIIISGRSGIGKSTLAKILSGLHTTYSGNIYLNGININGHLRGTITKKIMLVEQQCKLFSGTLYENIVYNSSEPSLQELNMILNLTCCDEIINNFTQGLDTYVHGSGKNLSGGQIQRICIARALLAKPQVLILDEVTTGLDQEMAKRIIKGLFSIKDLITIVISHNIQLENINYRLINLEKFLNPINNEHRVISFAEQ